VNKQPTRPRSNARLQADLDCFVATLLAMTHLHAQTIVLWNHRWTPKTSLVMAGFVARNSLSVFICVHLWFHFLLRRGLAFGYTGHLVFDQPRIEPAPHRQLGVRAGFDHPASIQHQDDVGRLNR